MKAGRIKIGKKRQKELNEGGKDTMKAGRIK